MLILLRLEHALSTLGALVVETRTLSIVHPELGLLYLLLAH